MKAQPSAMPRSASDIRIGFLLRRPAGMGDGAVACRPHSLPVAPDGAAGAIVLPRLPMLGALGKLRLGEPDREGADIGVDVDDVAIADEGNRAADRRLRSDMADAEATRCAREASIGDQSELVAHALTVQRRRGRQHLAHAGAAARPLVADDEDLAFLVAAIGDRLEALLFGVE